MFVRDFCDHLAQLACYDWRMAPQKCHVKWYAMLWQAVKTQNREGRYFRPSK